MLRAGVTVAAAASLLLAAVALLAGLDRDHPSALAADKTRPVQKHPGHAHHHIRIPPGIHKIKHVIVIMQENRSFDSYFGTYPGADGIPRRNGVPIACLRHELGGPCQRPYHDTSDRNRGGPHGAADAVADIDGGRMDGCLSHAEESRKGCRHPNDPECLAKGPVDVMGYHTAHEIPNYWAYAHHYVLQDHMFEPNSSWSLPAHLFLVSEWSA